MGIWALIGNIIWLVFGPGFACFLFWVLAGALLAIHDLQSGNGLVTCAEFTRP